MHHTISIYDAGPAVFDYSKTKANGERDCLVIRDEHRAICEKIAEEFSSADQQITIKLIFPADTAFIPTEEELSDMSLFSSRIAHSCESDIWRSDIVLADVSPWPKAVRENDVSPMSDEGTVYEVGFASGIADTLQKLHTLAGEQPELYEAIEKIEQSLGKPKIVVPYNCCPLTIEEKMAHYFGSDLYQHQGMTFSTIDHTMIENFGDTNNAMLSHSARKQGLEIQSDFEAALRVGVRSHLDRI